MIRTSFAAKNAAQRDIDDLINDRTLEEVVAAFGVQRRELSDGSFVEVSPPDRFQNPRGASKQAIAQAKQRWLLRLQRYGRVVFDLRGGQERNKAMKAIDMNFNPGQPGAFTERQIRAVHAAAYKRKATGVHKPTQFHVSAALLMGAAPEVVVKRAFYLRRLLTGEEHGRPMRIDHIGLMASQKPVTQKEREAGFKELERVAGIINENALGAPVDLTTARARLLGSEPLRECDAIEIIAGALLGAEVT